MARTKLTPGRIAAFSLPCGASQAFLWAKQADQLAVRVTAGTKAYIFQSRLNGRSIRMTIGSVDAWDVDGARAEATRLQNLIDQGKDPRLVKAATTAADEATRDKARSRTATLAEAWTAYKADRKSEWSARHLADHEALARSGGVKRKRGEGTIAPGSLHALMALKLQDLTAETVAAWLQRENRKRPTRAALAYRLLRAFVRWCASDPKYKAAVHLDAVGSKLAKKHVKTAKPKHDDCLQREQLNPWFKAVRELGNPVQAAYLQTLLLTGPRREELAGLKWAGVDFQWKSLRISDKVEGERTIPLTPYVSSLLAALPRRNAFVFSSVGAEGGRMQEPRIAHNRALAAGGLPHLSIHGLRRSFSTLSEWVECPVGVVAQIMGHKPSAISEKHYKRRPLDLLRMWHVRIEAWILEQAGIKQPEDSAALRVVK